MLAQEARADKDLHIILDEFFHHLGENGRTPSAARAAIPVLEERKEIVTLLQSFSASLNVSRKEKRVTEDRDDDANMRRKDTQQNNTNILCYQK